MTIRQRLIAAAFLSSALVATTAAVSTAFLFQAASHLHEIQGSRLPLMNSAQRTIDSASKLAMNLDDFAEAFAAGDKRTADVSRAQSSDEFNKLELSVRAVDVAPSQGQKRIDSKLKIQLEHLRGQLNSLKQLWERCEAIDMSRARRSEADELNDLDDKATSIVLDVVSLQDRVSKGISDAVKEADSNIRSVCRISIVVACAMTLITVTTGTVFATHLARRLIQVNEHAKRVGKGQLDTTIELGGKDEIGEIAVSLNAMVSELRDSRAKLEREAHYDTLTGLPNRANFLSRLTDRLDTANRTAQHDYALCFIDVDHFKTVNDTLGHAAGDELLRGVASRLQIFSNQFGETRTLAARLGGDEFTILLDKVGADNLHSIEKDLREICTQPLILEGQSVRISLSIGMALGDSSVINPKTLLGRADAALYHTKRQGRNGFTLYRDTTILPPETGVCRSDREAV